MKGHIPVGNVVAAILAWSFFGWHVGLIALIVAIKIEYKVG